MGPMSRNGGNLLETYAAYNPRREKNLNQPFDWGASRLIDTPHPSRRFQLAHTAADNATLSLTPLMFWRLKRIFVSKHKWLTDTAPNLQILLAPPLHSQGASQERGVNCGVDHTHALHSQPSPLPASSVLCQPGRAIDKLG